MKYCPECGSVMTKTTTTDGTIVFQCRCQLTVPGKPEDSLMFEQQMDTAESYQKHDVFIENAPFDLAGYIVLKDCPSCGINYMTLIRIGINATVMYTCQCGYRATHAEYMKEFDKTAQKQPSE